MLISFTDVLLVVLRQPVTAYTDTFMKSLH